VNGREARESGSRLKAQVALPFSENEIDGLRSSVGRINDGTGLGQMAVPYAIECVGALWTGSPLEKIANTGHVGVAGGAVQLMSDEDAGIMGKLGVVKQLALSVGVYGPARALHRAFSPSERRSYKEDRSLFSKFVKPGDLVFDVGASIGAKTEVFLSLGARVIAFEPQAQCCREISARVRGDKRLTIVNKAVGAREGIATLYLSSAAPLASLLSNRDYGYGNARRIGTTTVPVTTLDVAIEQFGIPAFCKVDVEGFEVEVLNGLSHKISHLCLEYHDKVEDIRTIKECMDILAERQNYVVNLTGQERATFLSPRWLTIEEFKDSFPGCAQGNFWGDVFIRPA
jgi:FkbM family methyltransferase